MHRAQLQQPLRCGFRREIALRHRQHFKADHEFAHSRGPEQRRVEMQMKMGFGVRPSIAWRLMKTHRIWKRNLKQVIIASCDLFQNIGQVAYLGPIQVCESSKMAP